MYECYLKHPVICTDTRKLEPGCLFFALKGPRFDGNRYAKSALAAGAAYAIVDDEDVVNEEGLIRVDSVLETLQKLAAYHRQQKDIPVIAITGSNGKTTTKELTTAVFGSHYLTHYTSGNFNNHIGVPITLLRMPSDTEVAIIEMGANHIGEIDFLCNIAAPTHGLITNVGKAHLEGFGDFEGVKKAKGELYRYLEKTRGLAFVNQDEFFLEEMAGAGLKKVLYRESNSPDPLNPVFETQLLKMDPFLRLSFLSENGSLVEVNTNLIGKYNFNNVMTAITLGRYFKVPSAKIKKALENYMPSNNRSQIVRKGSNKFLLDAYNANPTSMTKALESFAAYKEKNKVAILGDMLELGIFSREAHQKIVDLAVDLAIPVITVGEEFGKIKSRQIKNFPNTTSLIKWFWKQSYEDTFFLLKGSRGIALEALLEN